ncbi:MAG: hypothetical protein ABMB14_21360, partial [Myxococcota bacterium]
MPSLVSSAVAARGPIWSQISRHTTDAGWPSAVGCFPPTIATYASLYRLTSCGPHHTNIGWREVSRIRTAVCRLRGQPSGGPSGLPVQSNARIRAPISPSLSEP